MAEWQRNVLCRYFMVGACQRGPACPYSHDRNISRKGTLPCRFFQVGTCANGTECRFSHGSSPGGPEAETGDPSAVTSLTIQMDSFTFDQSEVGSEGSYEASLGSYEEGGVTLTPGYPVMMEPSGYAMEPVYEASGGYYPSGQHQPGYWSEYTGPGGGAVTQLSLSPQVVVTVLPAPPPPQPCCDHPKSDQREPEANNNIVECEESSASVSSASPSSPSTLCDSRPDPPTLVPLTKSRPGKAEAKWTAPQDWAEAAEFVPSVGGSEGDKARPKSWAQVVNTGLTYPGMELSISQAESLLCPFYKVGECRYGEGCAYIHGDICDYCGQASLHPTHLDQRRAHLAECLQEHERDMELSFAVARSREKTCGICMEVVLDKPKGEARFGILPSCNHCFCLSCIRKWRNAKQFEHKIIRACPECRQTSDYICPSRFWVETEEEKGRLLGDYRRNLGQKECKYFNKGAGECPFGNKCFYQHADKDGRVVDVGPPKKPVRRADRDGNMTLVQRLLLYDFLEERDGQLVLPLDFVELLDLYSDEEDEPSDEGDNN